jgi:hypothetical protein
MTVSLSDIATILTAGVALAGLILSIYNFYVDRRDKSPRLVAKISNGFLTSGPELSDLMLLLEIANPGEKMVKISAVEIAWKKRKLFFFKGIDGTVKIPFELQPGDSATFWTPIKEVAWALSEQGCKNQESVKACFRTAVGTEFISKTFPVNVREWAKPK